MSRILDLSAAFMLLVAAPLARPASAAELIMFEQPGCPFCARFDAEIAPHYAESRIGRIAPLRRVNIWEDRRGGIASLLPAAFTPTFVLVDDENREVGRLEGYPGRQWFYPEIERIAEKLPLQTDATVKSGGGAEWPRDAGGAFEQKTAAPQAPD